MPELKTFTREEVAKHSNVEGNDCWIIIDSEGTPRFLWVCCVVRKH